MTVGGSLAPVALLAASIPGQRGSFRDVTDFQNKSYPALDETAIPTEPIHQELVEGVSHACG